MGRIHDQLRARRKELGLHQSDMLLRAGIIRQQYHRLENEGNPSLKILELAAAGLEMALMLVPKERLREVNALLPPQSGKVAAEHPETFPAKNPWKELLGNCDDD